MQMHNEAEAGHSPAPSLVGGSKSSTADLDAINRMAALASLDEVDHVEPVTDTRKEAGKMLAVTVEPWRDIKIDKETNAPYTPINFEGAVWRAVTWTETEGQAEPPRQEGDRWTKRLSDRAAKNIEYSAKYLHRVRRGYRTFLTLTFDQDARNDILLHDKRSAFELPNNIHGPVIPEATRKTIGRRVTEFLNVLQQRHRNGLTFKDHYRRHGKQKRGGCYESKQLGKVTAWTNSARWTPIIEREKFTIEGQGRPFQFTWVAENPENENGERNPHIHILMNWHVKQDQFHAWAKWIEKSWGKGFAKLERIKKPAAAANYMAKAANYISKGNNSDQGPIRGNRYAIARDGRAPKAKHIGTYAALWIRKAIELGYKQGREQLPKGLWFHRHGFGANGRTLWRKVWQAIKDDGFQFKPAVTLISDKLQNATRQYIDKKDYLCGLNIERMADSLLKDFKQHGENMPGLSLSELENHWGTYH